MEDQSTSSGCSFGVRAVGVEDPSEDGVVIVGLAEYPDGDGQNLIFQLGLEFDEQDVALGMDTYCLSVETGATFYGGVTSCVLDGDLLTIGLDAEAAATLRTGEECRLRLMVPPESIALVAEVLRKVLTGGGATPTRLIL